MQQLLDQIKTLKTELKLWEKQNGTRCNVEEIKQKYQQYKQLKAQLAQTEQNKSNDRLKTHAISLHFKVKRGSNKKIKTNIEELQKGRHADCSDTTVLNSSAQGEILGHDQVQEQQLQHEINQEQEQEKEKEQNNFSLETSSFALPAQRKCYSLNEIRQNIHSNNSGKFHQDGDYADQTDQPLSDNGNENYIEQSPVDKMLCGDGLEASTSKYNAKIKRKATMKRSTRRVKLKVVDTNTKLPASLRKTNTRKRTESNGNLLVSNNFTKMKIGKKNKGADRRKLFYKKITKNKKN
ncbi:hypothetical protein AX774_g5223 [Zancudomyces culisetae]|uniref:Uncharacterized protein n=1 Tax=Zancudomyces culisetae TaxID=1213189 RepID=A0A1R1PK10_ZANCU|nr:hypothetical protein AX774_g5223 [Zancudomyces culisetae]|eukprot:OMH81310.1 hypothetical protein AX774_g5223 [Zancudomyces culisetae]